MRTLPGRLRQLRFRDHGGGRAAVPVPPAGGLVAAGRAALQVSRVRSPMPARTPRPPPIAVATQLLELCRTVHERTGAEVLLGNFMLPARRDLGEFRSRTLASDWNFRKRVNLELGLNAPPFVRICDLEFLANRRGALAGGGCARVVREQAAVLVLAARGPLPRGRAPDPRPARAAEESARARPRQHALGRRRWRTTAWKASRSATPRRAARRSRRSRSTSRRSRTAACCSRCAARTTTRGAVEPFEKHPEMVLRLADFVVVQGELGAEVRQPPADGRGAATWASTASCSWTTTRRRSRSSASSRRR